MEKIPEGTAPGFIDLHSHILFGCDDGPSDVEESLGMLEAYRAAGFSIVCATPHIIVNPYLSDLEGIRSGIEIIEKGYSSRGEGIRLLEGAEYYMDASFFERFERGEIITLGNNGRYILFEIPLFNTPDYIWEMAFKIQLKQYLPVLAHPERYHDVIIDHGIIDRFRSSGFLIQVNLGSFSGRYGGRVRAVSEFLLKNDMIDILASDCHRTDSVQRAVPSGIRRVERLAGRPALERLLTVNPLKILKGENIR